MQEEKKEIHSVGVHIAFDFSFLLAVIIGWAIAVLSEGNGFVFSAVFSVMAFYIFRNYSEQHQFGVMKTDDSEDES